LLQNAKKSFLLTILFHLSTFYVPAKKKFHADKKIASVTICSHFQDFSFKRKSMNFHP